MNTRIHQSQSKQSGQVLIIVALFLVALIGMLALVLDGGNLYVQRRRMQNAADAGALAGARALAKNGTTAEAQAAAESYAIVHNGADTAQVTIDADGLTVVACKDTQMTFARVLGVEHINVCARAGAMTGPIGSAVGLAPIAIRDFEYLFNVPYVIWDDDVERDLASGYISGSNRGWLSLNCVWPQVCGTAGADLLKEWMINGYPSAITFNSWIRGDGGVKAAVIQQAKVDQLLKIPVYDEIVNKASNQAYYHVLKFAAFRVTEVYASGNPKGIRGYFEYHFSPGPPTGEEDGGWRGIDLTQ